uniref:ARAD1C39974p n=1 Tax=Blastobotrys adeninivorans TaxID=409370 RepID=A0A060T4B0_BLAAD
MVRSVAKYGMKSGVLPKPRDALPRLRTFWEQEELDKEKGGFADPKMKPKHTDLTPVVKKEKFADERIRHTAKPKSKPPKLNSDIAKWKNLTAEMRRKYYKDSILLQSRMDEKEKEERERKFREAREARLRIDNAEQSEATKLTLPTVESFLKGPFVRHRTPEETAELKAKRAVNRTITENQAKEQKAASLLELYQKSSDFIIDEVELEEKINKEFNITPSQGILNSDLLKGHGFEGFINQEKSVEKKLTQALLGTTSNLMPGYPEVAQALNKSAQKYEATEEPNSASNGSDKA